MDLERTIKLCRKPLPSLSEIEQLMESNQQKENEAEAFARFWDTYTRGKNPLPPEKTLRYLLEET